MTEKLEYSNIFDAVTDDKTQAMIMKHNSDLRIEHRNFCQRLTDGTGITFRISDDTCESVGIGQFSYWVTSWAKYPVEAPGFVLLASNSIDEVYHGQLSDESALIEKINEIEDMV